MPHFVVEYYDGTDVAEARARLREDHIAYRRALGARMVMAGPLLQDFDGSPPFGSLVVIEAADRTEAVRIATEDPYVQGQVFQGVRVYGYRIAAFNPPAANGG